VSRRVRSAVVVTALALTLLCSGCVAGQGEPAADPTASSAGIGVDPAAERINELERLKQQLQARVDAVRTPVESSSIPASAGAAVTSIPGTTQNAAAASGIMATDQFTAQFTAQFSALERALGGSSGIAVEPVGPTGHLLAGGTLTSAVAWSTIKVPLAVAAVRAAGGRPTSATTSLIKRAITVSDNAAAESLWAKLGSPTAAASAVNTVLRQAGDTVTRVESRHIRTGYTSFGQTVWPLARQAKVAATLPCLSGAEPVLTAMSQITASQRWGLGLLGAGTRFKGGWGPGTDGKYLARQFGTITLPQGGQIAVAIATRPTDGSFTTATAHLNTIADWLRQRLASLTGGHC
jgi:hypothetical protein